MQKKATEPSIRFAGFTDPWERRKLGEIGVITTGSTPSTAVANNYSKDGMLWVTPTDISEYVTFETAKRLSKRGQQVARIVPKNTILVTCIASIGKNTMLGETGSFNQQINGLTADASKYDPYFLLAESVLWSKQMKRNAAAGTMQIVNRTEFSELSTCVPQIEEQRKIGSFISVLDNLITLHQRKYEKLLNLKKAMLDKMFPKNGELVPEVRFAGFSGNWKRRKLGEVGKAYAGLTGKSKNDFGHGTGKYVTYMNVFTNPVTSNQELDSIEIDGKQNEVRYGDVFFTTSSETPEEVGMASVCLSSFSNTYLNSFCFGFRLMNIEIDLKYLAYFLRSGNFRSKMIRLAQGISRYNISKSKVLELQLLLPSLQEQQMIGKWFAQLDNLIQLQVKKNERLSNIKSAILEKMFV